MRNRLLRLFQPFGKHVDSQFVGRHHDGCVGNLTNKLRTKPAIKAESSFIFVDSPQCLPK